jgi:hypothetical protein
MRRRAILDEVTAILEAAIGQGSRPPPRAISEIAAPPRSRRLDDVFGASVFLARPSHCFARGAPIFRGCRPLAINARDPGSNRREGVLQWGRDRDGSSGKPWETP